MSGHLERHMRQAHNNCGGPYTVEHHDHHHRFDNHLQHVHPAPLVDPSAITQLGVDLELKDNAWFDHTADSPVVSGDIERVGVMPDATTNHQPAVAILVTLQDGTKVVATTTWRNFSLAMVALIARWGTP